jgi:hypothetical protein
MYWLASKLRNALLTSAAEGVAVAAQALPQKTSCSLA